MSDKNTVARDPVLKISRLGFPWQTEDPFLFCVYHKDAYPKGTEQMRPAASLKGRRMGMDFEGRDGWRMYHGRLRPGFPQHPHRGFETITVIRHGYVDHSDSLGATARIGPGDVQWMTAGRGIVHAEMFPLLRTDRPNPTEFFQLWINLPRRNKMVPPHFSMYWRDEMPTRTLHDKAGRAVQVRVVTGAFGDSKAPKPPPKSWASEPGAEVAIWTIELAANAQWTVPAGAAGLNRMLYFFDGRGMQIGGHSVPVTSGVKVVSNMAVPLQAGPEGAKLVMLQGKPIGEPVAQRGPFVMNTWDEIRQAYSDYHRTQFGGWPWKDDEPVHPRTAGRFARHADGKVEKRKG